MVYVIGTYMFISRLARIGWVPLDDKPADAPSTTWRFLSIESGGHKSMAATPVQ